ncbi:tRNA 2-thiocytidine biosynthesis protein TtcA [Breznakia sp. PF5-3]|uniref:tRNA lysidine(34) synthetase n=1 Tax=unclassified Breznakia TaxID=2623764 RepID=UPI002404CEDA|nr:MULTISPECIES: ATP-binding protein [unclassified Breznakia]MDL2276464.1 tRNA 2-thiocytidine(32) synthetase TtcA [Breznakia sp. OttesenSCG-928-G09]MDF9823903.1 tRNA 2-thiocytidine biosynthesis protein TtcA [Breznakia sp. PM6-1]MDF9834702.1 tRNA 2-thiocytidine biosynthesis protein TtcA [Breznakia sp. PF5-3]MDF9836863.1 tRNA 2-thiocytidine biosynthesis protein TtcA [Breznakia sp. PFB2-8]MDF9858880.1 tRNA 2-thiocytidine biosynthesis protein TtcA [Breznakia sp. PH5-24]
MKKILKYIRKADEDYHLIENGDTIAIGVSGGKDSMVLLKALHEYQKFDHKHFQILAIHLKMGFPNMDMSDIQAFCTTSSIPYHEEDVPIYEILTHYQKTDGRLDCSRCSNLKRGAIVNVAKEKHCNKIAFAHHGDDAVETFLLNAIYSGKVSTFQPKIHYEDNDITFIRPLIYVHEKDIIANVKANEIPIVESTCPQDGYSKREDMKKLLKQLYDTYPEAKNNLLNMLSNGTVQLWKKEK